MYYCAVSKPYFTLWILIGFIAGVFILFFFNFSNSNLCGSVNLKKKKKIITDLVGKISFLQIINTYYIEWLIFAAEIFFLNSFLV